MDVYGMVDVIIIVDIHMCSEYTCCGCLPSCINDYSIIEPLRLSPAEQRTHLTGKRKPPAHPVFPYSPPLALSQGCQVPRHRRLQLCQLR